MRLTSLFLFSLIFQISISAQNSICYQFVHEDSIKTLDILLTSTSRHQVFMSSEEGLVVGNLIEDGIYEMLIYVNGQQVGRVDSIELTGEEIDFRVFDLAAEALHFKESSRLRLEEDVLLVPDEVRATIAKPGTIVTFDSDTYEEATEIVVDEVLSAPMSASPPSSSSKDKGERRKAKVESAKMKSSEIQPKAGTLTASSWRDLDHWDLWLELIEEDYAPYTESWSIKPTRKKTIQLENERGNRLGGIKVRLLSGQLLIDEAFTDHSGLVNFWLDDKMFEHSKLELEVEELSERFPLSEQAIQQTFTLNLDCDNPSSVEIAFLVDATGSMSDELIYLETEIEDIAQQLSYRKEDHQFSFGAIYYRDYEEEYLCRRLPLTRDIKKLSSFFSQQQASGGGNYPEALDVALSTMVEDYNWSQSSKKIAFLVLDAPAHSDEKSVMRLNSAITRARNMGITIIPIASSGIEKGAEYLFKSIAVLTNGTYVYLTDHSGVGNSHLDASNESTGVFPLNQLILDLVLQQLESDCTYEKVENTNILNSEWDNYAEVFLSPNPCQDFLNVSAEADIQRLSIFNLAGELMMDFSPENSSTYRINVSNLHSGTYIIHCQIANKKTIMKFVIAD